MLQENSTLSVILDAEKSGWSEDLWNVMAASGLPWIGVPEESGGSGGSFDEALKVIRWCGYFAVPLPISETGFLGGWLLSQAGLKVAGSPISAAVADSRDLLHLKKVDGHFLASGVLHRVPWASHVSAIVALADLDGEKYVLSIPTKKVTILPGRNMAFEPRCQVDFINVPLDQDSLGLAPIGITDFSLQLRGALARATLIAGACQAATDISVDYARNRQAFGVPIAKFQAIQHHLVRAAIETDLVTSAALVASQSLLSTDSTLHISAAKVAAGRAARVVAAESHQVHGAIGMTQEYELHPRTRRIHSWSHEYGSEIEWARRLGAIIGRIPKDELWPTLSAPPASIASEAR
jgi:acyl-CoA dehydrogenase